CQNTSELIADFTVETIINYLRYMNNTSSSLKVLFLIECRRGPAIAKHRNQCPKDLHGEIAQYHSNHERRHFAIDINSTKFQQYALDNPSQEKRKPQHISCPGGHNGIGQRIEGKPIK